MSRLNAILIGAALLVALGLTMLGPSLIRSVQGTFLSIASPFLKTGQAVHREFGAVGEALKTLDQLEVDNRKLEIENRELRANVQILRNLEAENNQLRDALNFVRRSEFRLIPAEVVSRDASTWWNTIRINRGFEDGVEADMPVITDLGLVGKIVAVSKNISNVLLITDENCQIGARVEGTREQGIAHGRRVSEAASGEIELNFLSKQAQIQPDASVFTVGAEGGVFPAGLNVGKVKSFRTRELDGQAILEPAVDLANVRDVFVIATK